MSIFRKKSVKNILEQSSQGKDSQLRKHLGVRDLTALGIAAIIGAGIFSTIGNASANGGPGVIFLFLFTAIACGFAAFAYAEFASIVPVSGSAYTYSYVAFGEIIAWVIGWSLIMEYAIGNITVAISWSDYFTGLLGSMQVHIPDWATMDFMSAFNGHSTAEKLMAAGKSFEGLDKPLQDAFTAWTTAPTLGSFHFIADLPALFIIIVITALVYRGIKESRNASNLMVAIKLLVVLLVIAVGIFYVDTNNWNPFLPNGVGGILKGVSAIFFAYIGFDAISTTAEECKNPQRDLPRGMMWAIIICTLLYIAIALVLTGMVKYDQLSVGDPLAFVFDTINLKWMSGIIGVSAIVAMASVLLVFQLGQPRIWMAMSRDGLLPKKFSTIHPKFNTPSFATIVTGFVVAVPALFMNLTMVTDLCSIGTLFAFVLVCAGVLKLHQDPDRPRGKFQIPYLNAKYVALPILLVGIILSLSYNQDGVKEFFTNKKQLYPAEDFINALSEKELSFVTYEVSLADAKGYKAADSDLSKYLASKDPSTYTHLIDSLQVAESKKYEQGWNLFKHKIPFYIFLITCLILCYYSIKYNLSTIPLLGLVSCLYMMSEMGWKNWIGFTIWLIIGLIIYFSYSRHRSVLNRQ
ncbi:MAG: hypothetical protein RIQ89_1643 [Bacteroidota bacterium]|jgi:amino acid transporter